MPKSIQKIFNVFTTAAVVLLVVLVVLLVGVRLFGLQVFTVLSGSMEPNYPTGSLIYVKKVETDTLAVDDVITYLISDDTVVTHRIAGIVPDEDDPGVTRFRTKGDANEAEDLVLVHQANVLGTPVFCIPYLGYVANFIQNPPGTYIALAIGSLVLMLMFIPDLFEKEDESAPKEEKKKGKRLKKKAKEAPSEEEKLPVPVGVAAEITKPDPALAAAAPVMEEEPVSAPVAVKPAEPAEPVQQKPAAKKTEPVPEKPEVQPSVEKTAPLPRKKPQTPQLETKPATPFEKAPRTVYTSSSVNPKSKDFDFEAFLSDLKDELEIQ